MIQRDQLAWRLTEDRLLCQLRCPLVNDMVVPVLQIVVRLKKFLVLFALLRGCLLLRHLRLLGLVLMTLERLLVRLSSEAPMGCLVVVKIGHFLIQKTFPIIKLAFAPLHILLHFGAHFPLDFTFDASLTVRDPCLGLQRPLMGLLNGS